MRSPRIALTRHAIDRFAERFATSSSWDDARRELEQLAETAERLDVPDQDGAALYHVSDYAMRLVVKRKRGELICLTVTAA